MLLVQILQNDLDKAKRAKRLILCSNTDTDLVRMQIAEGGEWNITSISVDGAGSMERTYSMGKKLLSVLIPYAGPINKAEDMIIA